MQNEKPKKFEQLNTVTPFSKYVAMTLFIGMPFIGGWIGYNIAPEKVVLVETFTPATVEDISSITISGAKVVNEGDIEVSLSNGEQKIVARSKKPDDVEQYFEIETFQEAFISPNRKFAALQAIGFEDPFIQIYNLGEDRLEDKIYGEVSDWDNLGRLGVLSCNLAGEDCTQYISSSPEMPWILEEVEE